MLALLLVACTATPDAPEPCGDGFARADDGNCYELGGDEDDTAAHAAEWGYVEVTCAGDGSYYAPTDLPTDDLTAVQAWGQVDPDVAALCASEQADGVPWVCDEVPAGAAWVTPSAPIAVNSDGDPSVYCWYATVDWEEYGYDIAVFVLNPIRLYYPG